MQNLGYGVIILLIAIVSNISTLFVYCYFGKLANDSFSDMSYRLFESNWQQLPLEMQKFFVLMIGNAQQTLHYHGLQIVRLDWETFTKVCTGSKFKQEKLCIWTIKSPIGVQESHSLLVLKLIKTHNLFLSFLCAFTANQICHGLLFDAQNHNIKMIQFFSMVHHTPINLFAYAWKIWIKIQNQFQRFCVSTFLHSFFMLL